MKFIPKPLVETADISRGKPTLKSFLKSAVSAVLVLALLYLFLGLVAELLARTIPDRWERQLSGAFPESTGADTNAMTRAAGILERLTKGESLRELDYHLFLFQQESPNAVAVPGGGIGVTAALLETVKSDAGLAFVLAHELGHHQHRHILRSLGRRLIIRTAAAMLLNYDGLSSVDTAFQLAESGYSRRQERAADEFALRLVHEKYGQAAGAMEFFEKIQEHRGDGLWMKYAGSHPPTAERLRYLRELAMQLKDGGVEPSSR